MAADNDIPGVVIFGKGRGEYPLPCGYVDAKNRVHNTATLRETRGDEEDILDDDGVTTTDRITRILSNCCEKLGEITDRELITRAIGDNLKEGEGLPLTNADRMAMMLAIHRVTKGDRYHIPDHKRRCPHCRKTIKPMHIDLSSLAIKPVKDATKRKVRFTLPDGRRKATVKILSAKGEERIAKLVRSETQRDLRSFAILARLEQIDDQRFEPDDRGALLRVKALSTNDRDMIRDVYNLIEGSIDTDLDMTCDKTTCALGWKTDIDIGQVFFSRPETKITEDALEWI